MVVYSGAGSRCRKSASCKMSARAVHAYCAIATPIACINRYPASSEAVQHLYFIAQTAFLHSEFRMPGLSTHQMRSRDTQCTLAHVVPFCPHICARMLPLWWRSRARVRLIMNPFGLQAHRFVCAAAHTHTQWHHTRNQCPASASGLIACQPHKAQTFLGT